MLVVQLIRRDISFIIIKTTQKTMWTEKETVQPYTQKPQPQPQPQDRTINLMSILYGFYISYMCSYSIFPIFTQTNAVVTTWTNTLFIISGASSSSSSSWVRGFLFICGPLFQLVHRTTKPYHHIYNIQTQMQKTRSMSKIHIRNHRKCNV